MRPVRSFLLAAAALLGAAAEAQIRPVTPADWRDVHFDRKRQMLTVLTGWGAANVVVGGTGALLSDDTQWRQFHLMNAGWGLVNAALGGFGLRSAHRDARAGLSLDDAYADLQRTERILLFNAGLDVAYMVGGAYLIQRADRPSGEQPERDRGWGRAVVLQGAGLFLFDLLAFRHLHKSQVGITPLLTARGAAVGLTVPID